LRDQEGEVTGLLKGGELLDDRVGAIHEEAEARSLSDFFCKSFIINKSNTPCKTSGGLIMRHLQMAVR
jgi:hypothetical protein